jgi:radical SAM superfamily enzyme YgiQ (UPF0313 family)
MKVLIISVNNEKNKYGMVLPFGAYCVYANAKKAGLNVDFLDLLDSSDPINTIKETIKHSNPDYIGISIRNIDNQDMEKPYFYLADIKNFIDTIKETTSSTIILGGAGFSIFPKECLNYLGVNFGIDGEGEKTFPTLINNLCKNQLVVREKHIIYSNFKENIDSYVLPGSKLISNKNDNNIILPIQTRKGCSFNCIYCSTHLIEGTSVRCRNIDTFVEWLSKWVNEGYRNFYFVDNTFNIPIDYTKKLLNKIIENKLPIKFNCLLYPKFVDTEMITLLKKAGCYQVSLGFESGSDNILKILNKRYTKDEVLRISEQLNKNKIEQVGFLLLGGPNENLETISESLNFIKDLPLDMLKITKGIRIYPNTKLATIAIQESKISNNTNLLYPTFYCSSEIYNHNVDKILSTFKNNVNFKVL